MNLIRTSFQYWNDHSWGNMQDLCTCYLLYTDTVWINRGHSTVVLSNISFFTYFSEVLIQLPTDNNQESKFPAVVT